MPTVASYWYSIALEITPLPGTMSRDVLSPKQGRNTEYKREGVDRQICLNDVSVPLSFTLLYASPGRGGDGGGGGGRGGGGRGAGWGARQRDRGSEQATAVVSMHCCCSLGITAAL